MERKSRWVLAAAAVVLSFNVAAAPASDASIDELMQLTQAEATMKAAYASMEPMMRTMMADLSRGETLTPEQQRTFDRFPAAFADVLRDEMGWAKMKPQMTELYREVFTQEEVDGQIAFYRSPAGQAMIAKMPLLVQKSMDMNARQMRTLVPRLQAAIKQALADAKAGR